MTQEVALLKRTVSHSEVESFVSCERKHFYNYGMKIQSRQLPTALRRGSLCHSTLEEYFTVLKNGGTKEEAEKATRDYLMKHMMLNPADHKIATEVKYALEWFFKADPFYGWTILAIEKEIVIRVDDQLDIPVIVDLIARDAQGKIWVIDHKTLYDFYSDRDLEVMFQLDKYVGVVTIDASVRGKKIKIERAGIHMLRYRETKSDNVADHNKLLRRPINDSKVKQVMAEQVIAAKRIQKRRQMVIDDPVNGLADWSEDALRSPSKDGCGWCMFRDLCMAELENDSPELILDSQYQIKPSREFEEAVE